MSLTHVTLGSQISDQHKAVADTKLAIMHWQLCAGTTISPSSNLKYHANTGSQERQMTKTQQLLNIVLRLCSHFSSNSFFLPAII